MLLPSHGIMDLAMGDGGRGQPRCRSLGGLAVWRFDILAVVRLGGLAVWRFGVSIEKNFVNEVLIKQFALGQNTVQLTLDGVGGWECGWRLGSPFWDGWKN